MGRVWCPSMLKSHLLQEASPAACNSPLAQFRLLCCMGLGLGFGAFLAVEARAALNGNMHRDLHLMACCRRCPADGNFPDFFKHDLGGICLPALEALLADSSWAPFGHLLPRLRRFGLSSSSLQWRRCKIMVRRWLPFKLGSDVLTAIPNKPGNV